MSSGNTEGFLTWVTQRLDTAHEGASAFALIENGEVEREHFRPRDEIDGNTLFPTASVSKLIAALTTMSLVEAGSLDLDASATTYSNRWQPPVSEFATSEVTFRRLLSHTAGLNDGLGFGDYRADEILPSTIASLRAPRSSDGVASIGLGTAPGTAFKYSGGGYHWLEFLIEEHTGRAFEEIAADRVLIPAGMHRSNFNYLGGQANAARSYAADGEPAELFQYASAAATALNSSTNDLVALAKTLAGDEPNVVSAETLATMRTPHAELYGAPIWGLGLMLYAPTAGGGHVFGHDGGNAPAINASVRVNPDTRDAIVVLVTGNLTLASEIAGEWTLWQTGQPDAFATTKILASAGSPAVVGWGVILLGVMLLVRPKATSG